MIDGNSVRDEVKDAIRNELCGWCLGRDSLMDAEDIDSNLVAGLADAVFDALGLDEEDQDQIRERGCFVWLQGIHSAIDAREEE